MPGTYPKFRLGPLTYEVSAVVHGGRLVALQTTAPNVGKVAEATATDTPLGVAHTDAAPDGTLVDGTDTFGNPIQNEYTVSKYVAVGYTGVYKIQAAGAIAPGASVVVAAGGMVATAGATPAAGTVVGRCVNSAGVATGELASIRLNLA